MLIVIVTDLGYPFGGGEDYMRQTISMNRKLGMDTVWLCFTDRHRRNYPVSSIVSLENAPVIKQSGGWKISVIQVWLRYLRPVLVHTQGGHVVDVVKSCTLLHIPVLVGVHFWLGMVTLGNQTGNQNILDHVGNHSPAPEFQDIVQHAKVYVASEFVQNVIARVNKVNIPLVLYPTPELESCRRRTVAGIQTTLINCHILKGGQMLLHLVKSCPNISFLGVVTEDGSDDLNSELRKAGCQLMAHAEDIRDVYDQTKVCLVPSLVDETFGRVMIEAMMNGIPVITSGTGNLSHFLRGEVPDLIIPVGSPERWVKELRRLYAPTDDYYQRMSLKMSSLYNRFYSNGLIQYRNIITQTIRTPMIMLFVPWSDQGLGIQARLYVEILNSCGYPACIFSFASYRGGHPQKDPSEWEHPRVYYSDHHREQVTPAEIDTFVRKYHPTVCLLPETVYDRIFIVARQLRQLNVVTMAIPNVEILKRQELLRHTVFDKVLFNNRLCQRIFDIENNNHGVLSHHLIGFGLQAINGSHKLSQGIRFLCLGGLNAFSRKNVDQVAHAFIQANLPNSVLTLTIQSGEDTPGMERMPPPHPNVKIITHPLTTKEIGTLYESTDCLIQVSRHEGLGLGFYEGLRFGLPCITLDVAPHNEIYTKQIGWLVEAQLKVAQENPDSFIQEAEFETENLVATIKEVFQVWSMSSAEWSGLRKRVTIQNDIYYQTFQRNFLNVIENAHPAISY